MALSVVRLSAEPIDGFPEVGNKDIDVLEHFRPESHALEVYMAEDEALEAEEKGLSLHLVEAIRKEIDAHGEFWAILSF